MIRATTARETRRRDRHRGRVLLQIGDYRFHLSREEAVRLKGQLALILAAPWMAREIEWDGDDEVMASDCLWGPGDE